jgi:hypothetical protein
MSDAAYNLVHIDQGHAHAPCGSYLNAGLRSQSLSGGTRALFNVTCPKCVRVLLDNCVDRMLELARAEAR